jgi:hypothetical protein
MSAWRGILHSKSIFDACDLPIFISDDLVALN